jgi:ligand-binding SRPBCC domain-containing protein
MKHVLESRMTLPLPRERVFEFFADPANLGRITPPAMRFRMLAGQNVTMAAGVQIDYRIRVFGLPLKWRSQIARWDPPHAFVDVQLKGPYKSWAHTHLFHEHGAGAQSESTEIEDRVEYELPLGPLGGLVRPLVARQLEEIFEFRCAAIERILLNGA